MRSLPWAKAPLLLFKRPGVAIALMVATVVATLPAVGTPLLISASQSDSIEQQLNDQCALPGGFHAKFARSGESYSEGGDGSLRTGVTIDALDREDVLAEIDRIEQLADRVDGLSEVDRTLSLGAPQPWTEHHGRVAGIRGGDGGYNSVFFIHRDAAFDRIAPVEGDFGPGAWVPTEFDGVAEVNPGDSVVTGLTTKVGSEAQLWDAFPGVDTEYTPGSEPVDLEIPVTGVYESLNGHPLMKTEWCHMEYGLNLAVTPEPEWRPTVLLDEETFWTLAEQAELSVQVHLRFELDEPPSLDQAAAISDQLAEIEPEVVSTGTTMDYEMPRFEHRAQVVGEALLLPIGVVSGAAILVGLCIVGASGVLWVRRRGVELAALAGRGVSPGALGLKGALEAFPAAVLGGVAGHWLCWLSMPWWAPVDRIDARAPVWSAVLGIGAVLAALLVVGVVSGRATRGFTEPVKIARRRFGTVPWELVPAGGAVAAWLWLDDSITVTSGDAADRVGQVAQLPGRAFVVPLLTALACAGMAARLLRTWWGRPQRRPMRGVSGFIASRRIRRDGWAGAVMVAAVAVPTALAGYAVTASSSVSETIDAQARSEIGSDVVVTFDEPTDIGDMLSRFGEATSVVRVDTLTMDRIKVSTLFVDVDSFERAADTVKLMAPGVDIAGVLSGDGVPALAIGTPEVVDGAATVNLPGPATMDIDVTTVPDLPGGRAGNPVVLISNEHLPELPWSSGYQWWVRTDDSAGVRDAVESRFEDATVAVSAERYDGTPKQSLTASMEYLLWVSLLTAVVVVVGILLRLESRAPANRRAYVVMRRMGLRSVTHRLALLREVGVLLGAGVAVGVVVSAVLVVTMATDFDIDPASGPGVVVTVPSLAVVWLTIATLATVCGAALFVHARIAAAKPSLVLRDTA